MPIIKSAKKRARQAVVRRDRNLITLRRVKQSRKNLAAAKASGNKKKVDEAVKELQSAVDTAVKKNVIHKNKAARILSRAIHADAPKKSAAPAKKPAAKKATAAKKKPAAKTAKTTTAKAKAVKK